MAPPKDIARSYPKRGLTADVGFRSEPAFVGDGSVEFDGSTQGAKSATSYSIVTTGAKTTIAGWALPRTLTGSNTTLFANIKDNTTDNFAIYRTGTNEIAAMADYGSLRELASAKNLDPNRWYFLAATFDYDTTTLKFYVDGVEFSETPSIGTGGTTGFFEMGYRDNGGSPLQHFDGNLAHVMLIEDVLTQGEIVELMRDTSYAKAQTFGTVNRYYELDADFNDDTGSHNATSYGSPSFTVDRPQLPRGLDLTRGAAQARVYTGRAVDFDGSADHMEAAVYSNSSDYYSVSVWVKPDTIGASRNIVASGSTGDNAFLIFLHSTGVIYFYGNDTGGDYAIIHQTTLTAGRWYHLAMAVDQSDAANNTIKAYIDGVENTTSKGYAGWVGNAALEIGARNSVTFFDGAIAGVKVFNSELTAAQIRELYHNPEQVLPTGVSASNLRRYYPLSDYNDTGGTGGRYFQDMGADGEPAEDQGSCTMAFAQPVPCPQLGLQQSATRLYYDGTTGTTYNVEVTGHSLNLPSFSIAFWGFFQSNNPNTTSCCFDTSGGGTFQYFINSTAGNLTVYNGAPVATFNGVVPRDEWVHVVITGHDSSPYIKCYVNGAEQTIDSGSALTTGLVATNYYLFSRSTNSLSHTGFGNNYSIYDSNLGASEVLELYNQGLGYDPRTNVGNYASASSLIRLYKFDDLTTVKDYSGNNAHADVNGTFEAASFPENASGSTIVGDFSMKRKGVSVLNPTATPNVSFVQSAIISNDGSLTPDPSKSGYSFSAFIRLQQASGIIPWYPTVFSGANYNTASQRFVLIFSGSIATLRMTMSDGLNPRNYLWPAAITNPEEWHQLAFTIDYTTSPNTTFKLYLDGALVSTQATHVHSAFDPGDILVGSYTYSNGNFPGAIACFKLYQTKLSDNEIEQIYNSDLRLIKGLDNE